MYSYVSFISRARSCLSTRHDHARQWSAFGDGSHNDQIAKLTAALTLTLRGTALLYYGEEIGMRDMPEVDLQAAPLGAHRPRADERDRARTPMQWSAEAGAGFTRGTAWLPIQAQAKSYNLAQEKNNPDSLYHWYAQLLKLRRENPALRGGAYVALDSANPNVFAFARKTTAGQGALIVLNTSAREQQANITGWPAAPPLLQSVLLASPAAAVPKASAIRIAAFGVSITAYREISAARTPAAAAQ